MSDDWGDDEPIVKNNYNQSNVVQPKGRGRGKPAVSEPQDDWGDDTAVTHNKTSNATKGGDDWGDDDWSGGQQSNNTNSYSNNRQNGGRSGGGGQCYNCGGSGHMSRECPEPKKERGEGRGPMKCFNCQTEGHHIRDCPEPKKERTTGGRNCFNCGSDSHMSRECTEPRKERPKTCYNCNQSGHMSNDCPEPKKERKPRNNYNSNNTIDSWDVSTDKANNKTNGNVDDFDWGDTNDSNTKENKEPKVGSSGCRNCGESGHFARECPNKKEGGNECRRCKKAGHKAMDCTEEVLGEDGKPLPPPYKPTLVNEDDESLYDTVPTGINFDRYEKIKVNVSGEDVPKAIIAFKDVITSDLISKAINRCKYTKPTPVQKYAIPIIMQKRDLMACAQTGSGKTAAFELPVLQDLLSMSDLPNLYGQQVQEPLCVVVSPTRELAIQIHTEAVKFAKGSIIKPALIYGGTSSGYQLANISRGAHFLVATPGRLLDFLNKGRISFAKLKYLILDEADRMIDQGFLPEVRRMVSHESMPDKSLRQTLMFSATFPEEVQNMAKEFLKENYLFLTVGIVGAANSDVEQTFVEVNFKEKRSKLMDILNNSESTDRTLVFVEKKKTADFLASYLSQNQMKATSIHGDRFQSQRETALYDFRSGNMPVLVATSVAARGLDIKDVKHVINYDLPKEIDEYVHRIGRTGRVGNVGKATSFFDPSNDSDVSLAKSLIRILSDADQCVPEFLTNSASGNGIYSSSSGPTFGGTDIRGGNQTSNDDDWE